MNRRAFLATTAAAATVVTMKAASAETVTPRLRWMAASDTDSIAD
jgi:hypothetical protein